MKTVRSTRISSASCCVCLLCCVLLGCHQEDSDAPTSTVGESAHVDDGTLIESGPQAVLEEELPAEHNRSPVVEPATFVHDPEAMLATEIAQVQYVTEREQMELKYKGKMLTVEGQVALVSPFKTAGVAYLYGFSQTQLGGRHLSTADRMMTDGVVGIGVGFNGDASPITRLKHGQWVRVKGECHTTWPHVHLTEVEFLAVGFPPKVDNRKEQNRSDEEIEQLGAVHEKVCEKLEELGVSALSNTDPSYRTTTPQVTLREKNFVAGGGIQPAILEQLNQLQYLHIQLEDPVTGELTIRDETLKQLAELKDLQALRITLEEEAKQRVTSDGLKALAKLRNLRRLEIRRGSYNSRAPLTDGSALADFTNLEKLEVIGLSGIRTKDEDLKFIEKLPRLRSIDLTGSAVTDKWLSTISGCVELRELYLAETAVTSQGLQAIAGCKELRYIDFSGTKIDDSVFKTLGQLPYLRQLKLKNTRITGEQMSALAELKFVEIMELSESDLTSTAMAPLARLPLLKTLDIRRSKVTDEGLMKFADRTSEIVIDATGTPITEEGRNRLMRKRIKARVNLNE